MNDLELDCLSADRQLFSAWWEKLRAQSAYKKTFYRGTRLTEIYAGADYGSAENATPIGLDDEDLRLVNG